MTFINKKLFYAYVRIVVRQIDNGGAAMCACTAVQEKLETKNLFQFFLL